MFLWIIWLFEGFSGSNLMLLSTFPIQKSLYYYTYVLKESISDGQIIRNTRILQSGLTKVWLVAILAIMNIRRSFLLIFWKNIVIIS